MAEGETKKILGAFVAVLIGVILIAPINDAVTDAGFSGTLGTVASLIPLLFGIGVLYAAVTHML